MCEATTNKREYIGVCCWLAGWLAWGGTGHRAAAAPNQESQASKQRTLNGISIIAHRVCATNQQRWVPG